MQTAYELEVKGKNVDWNSGKVFSTKSQLVKYTVAPLQNGEKYFWRVRIWDEKQNSTKWSKWAEFKISPILKSPKGDIGGFWIGAIRSEDAKIPAGKRFASNEMGTPEYKAVWKNIDTLSRRSILLRKSFSGNKKISEAITYICGLGQYELSINGKKIGNSEFEPFWSDYDKTVYYNTIDVTKALRKGENVFGVLLGNGFYNTQGGRYSKLRVSFGAPTLFMKTIGRFTDGTVQEINSDKTWKYDISPITFNDIYGGEDYDARLEQNGWNLPQFNDQHWKPVVIQDAPKGVLTPQQGASVKIMAKYDYQKDKIVYLYKDTLGKFSKTPPEGAGGLPSAVVFDMYQNLAGYPEITVRGKKGDKITLVVAENVTPEGASDQRQTGRPHIYNYTLQGEGDETWHPRFSYYGFHFIQVEGAVLKGDENPCNLPVLKDIKSCFVYNSTSKTSTFECSNDIFNRTHQLILNATQSNMQGIFTDCPQREKLGWIEQLHLNGPLLLYNYNMASFLPKIMQDMVDAQQPDGAVPSIAPMYNIFGDKDKFDDFGVSPEWGSSILIMPWMYYEFYGDASIITNNYSSMKRWVDYLTNRANNHILSFGLGDWYDYGNFRAGFSMNTPIPYVATSYYFYALKYLAKSAKLIENQTDFDKYSALAEEVRKTINTKFFNAEKNIYATGSQTALAMAIYMDIVNPENRSAVLNNLVIDIKAHGNRLTTGDIGNRYLFQTLAENSLNDLMYTMQNHYDVPGYGFQLKMGATTLTEQWDPRNGASWNHFMMGQIDEWFFKTLAGIQSKENEPGMQHFVIKPEVVGDLNFVNESTETLYGKISVNWKREGNKFTLNVVVPTNCTADVYLPNEKEFKTVKSGKYTFEKDLE